MRKLTSILLLFLFLFNLLGYRFWFNYVQAEANKQLEASIDNENYQEQDLITIKVPLSLPYQYLQKDFERVKGEVTWNGKIYNYVKRKVTNGELVLLCLPNCHKMRLQTAKDDFFKLANDLEQNHSSRSSDKGSLYKIAISDYDDQCQQQNIIHSFLKQPLFYNTTCSYKLSSVVLTAPKQPPEPVLA